MSDLDLEALRVDPPNAPPIPGFRLRRWTGPDELPAMHAVATAARIANGDPWRPSLDQMRLDYAHLTNCDLDLDLALAEVDGRLVAYGRTWWEDRTDGSRSYLSFGFVDPTWRRCRVGTAIHDWLERRALAIGAAHLTARPRLLASFGEDADPGNAALLRNAGYVVERRFVLMVRPHLHAISVSPLPTELEIRPATMADARAMFEGGVEAFRDHWGSSDGSDEAWIRFRDRPDLDPSLWVLAWDGAALAGAVQLEIDAPAETADAVTDEPRIGWLSRVWVRRPWRRRGLAAALIGRSLVALRDRGADVAKLGVDVDNENRALDLYARAGFVVESTESAWSKPWPSPGSTPDEDAPRS